MAEADFIDLAQEDWLYHPGRPAKTYADAQHRNQRGAVRLPHSWNQKDSFQTGVDYRRGWGSYYKTVSAKRVEYTTGLRCLICTDGFFGFGFLRINGKKVLNFDAQYLGFEFDLTPHLSTDSDLEICIAVSNLHRSRVLPGIKDPDYLLYGGLAASVRLEFRPEVQVSKDSLHAFCEWHNGTPDLQIECEAENLSDKSWQGEVHWHLSSRGDTWHSREEGVVVVHLEPGTRRKVICRLENLTEIDRWDLANPVLYRITGNVVSDGEVIQHIDIPFGFREIRFDEQGRFLLNGEAVYIRGCNRHESMPGFGNAMPDALHAEDAKRIQSLGFNAVRLSHYPQSPVFLDACDELGLLVYAEIASWKTVKTGRWLTSAQRQLEAMIRRDRNHPSIILWGLGNESRSKKAFAAMTEIIRALDPRRLTIYAENHLYRAKRKNTLNSVDVWGCNYELELIEELKRYSRTGAVLVSECSNQPHALRGDLEEELEQVKRLDRSLTVIDRSGAAGFFIWSFQDYATLRKKRYARYCGVVDAWRQPKLATAYLAVRWNPGLDVRGFILDGHLIVFSNGEVLEIQTGTRSSRISAPGLVYKERATDIGTPVTLVTKRGGKEKRVTLSPAGSGIQIQLTSSRLGASLYQIDVRVVDPQGNVDPHWHGDIGLHLTGEGRLSFFTEKETVWVRAGKARVYLETPEPGLTQIQAEHPDLTAASWESSL